MHPFQLPFLKANGRKYSWPIFLLSFLLGLPPAVAGFRASVVKVDITPEKPQNLIGYNPRMSNGVLDRIYHKVVMIDDGKNQFYLVSSDLAAIAPCTYDHAAERLTKLFKISPKDFWWTNTHTHSAPEVGSPGVIKLFLGERYQETYDKEYTAWVEDKLVEAITKARNSLVPARLGVGWGFSMANVNRRARDIDNVTNLGINPDGPIDRRIGLIRLDKEDGSPLALISNYPIHGTALNETNLKISGDVPGVVANYVEEKIGAPLLFINGAEGNVAPIYSQGSSVKRLMQFRALLGDKILEANKRITATTPELTLATSIMTVETARRPDITTWPEDVKRYARTTKGGQHLVRIPVSFLKINDDIAIWAAPLELFCEVSNEVREKSQFPFTFYYGITNGTLGYLPTKEEIPLGGYEPLISPFTAEAAHDLSEAVTNFLQSEMKTLR
jgi:neutral ceramidase